jgi:hypothetical protein
MDATTFAGLVRSGLKSQENGGAQDFTSLHRTSFHNQAHVKYSLLYAAIHPQSPHTPIHHQPLTYLLAAAK